MYDLIVVGAGPAGITAAVYSARKKLNILVLTNNIGGQAALSGDIGNYTGFQFITGIDLAKKFEEHIKTFENIELHENEAVECVTKENDLFNVKTGKETYRGKTVILTTGRKPRLLNIPGEEDFKNRGVTYCATCDGPLFADKDVAIIGGGNSALDATLQMINIAKKIYLINKNPELKGEEVMIEKILDNPKVEILNNSNSKKIIGDVFVEKLVIEQNGNEKEISVNGIFVEVGSEPVKGPACDTLDLNEYNEIIVNEKCETNIPGLYAAGDLTNVPYKQIIVAAGQGCVASLSSFEYLSRMK